MKLKLTFCRIMMALLIILYNFWKKLMKNVYIKLMKKMIFIYQN